MDIKYWNHSIVPILVLLSNRINSDKEFWISIGDNGKTFCHICQRYINRDAPNAKESFYLLQEHGIQHLKDKNLLPFI